MYQQGRGGCLTTWLVVQGIGVVLTTCAIFAGAARGLDIAYALVLMLLLLFSAASIRGLWSMKKWGYYLQMTLYAVSIAFLVISACATNTTIFTLPAYWIVSTLGSLFAMLILYMLAHDRWDLFA